MDILSNKYVEAKSTEARRLHGLRMQCASLLFNIQNLFPISLHHITRRSLLGLTRPYSSFQRITASNLPSKVVAFTPIDIIKNTATQSSFSTQTTPLTSSSTSIPSPIPLPSPFSIPSALISQAGKVYTRRQPSTYPITHSRPNLHYPTP